MDDNRFPFALRVGAVGAGIGVGCGVGLGFGAPLSLGGIPAIGQAAQGINAGLSQLPGMHNVAGAVRSQVQCLGVKGLDAGFGCGIGIGYGFGAGLMLKPGAWEGAVHALQAAAGQAADRAQELLAAAGIKIPPVGGPSSLQTGANNPTQSTTLHPPSCLQPQQLHMPMVTSAQTAVGFQSMQQPAVQAHMGNDPMMQSSNSPGQHAAFIGTADRATPLQQLAQGLATSAAQASHSMPGLLGSPGTQPGAVTHGSEALTIALAALLAQQQEIEKLKCSNKELRKAVCRLDKRSPVCRDCSDNEL